MAFDQRAGLPTQTANQLIHAAVVDFPEPALLDVLEPDACHLLERGDLCFLSRFALLDQTQTFAQHLAGVLITPGLHQVGDHLFMVLGQDTLRVGIVMSALWQRACRK